MDQQPQVQQFSDIDLTFKLSFIQNVLMSLDEVPHKYVRNLIDAITQETNKQLKELQEKQQ